MKASAIDYFVDGYPSVQNIFPSEIFCTRPAHSIFYLQGDGFCPDLYKKCSGRHETGVKTWRFPPGSFKNRLKRFEISLDREGNRFKSCAIEPIVFGTGAVQLFPALVQSFPGLKQFCFGLRQYIFSPGQRIFRVDHYKKPGKRPGYRVKLFFKRLEGLCGAVGTYFNRLESCAIIPIVFSTGAVQFVFGLILTCPGVKIFLTGLAHFCSRVEIFSPGLVHCISGPGRKVKDAYRWYPGDERNKRNIKRYILNGGESCIGHGFHFPGRFTGRRC